MLRLKTFGGLALTNGGLEQPQPPRRLALLARLAPLGRTGVRRAELLADLWPERDADTARHNLDQLLYELRRSLDASPVEGTAALRLDSTVISADVLDFTSAIDRGDFAEAITLYGGPFLQGFYIQGAAEFERWVESTRDRLAAHHRRALEQLAKNATDSHAYEDAVRWWRQLADADRLSSRVALGLMRALVDAGDSVGALEHARTYDRVVRAELETAPDPAVMSFAESLRRPDGVRNGTPVARVPPESPVPDLAVAPAPNVDDPRRGSYRRLTLSVGLVLVMVVVAFVTTWTLQADTTRRPATFPKSIAALPMEDLSGTDDRFADGMTEQLISALGLMEGWRVIGRTSVFEFKASRLGARAIADSLRVSTLLESSLLRDSSRLHLTVRLIDGATGLQQWQETFNPELSDVSAVQNSIVNSVAKQLRARLAGHRSERGTTNIAAHDRYLQARDQTLTRNDSTVQVAIEFLSQSIALDTSFAEAFAARAELQLTALAGGGFGPDARRRLYARAKQDAERALALDDSSAEAHRALGIVSLFGYKLHAAETELRRARELDPGNPGVSGYLSAVYQWTGRTKESVAEAERELRKEPLSPGTIANFAHALYFDKRYDEARAAIDKVRALNPPLRRAVQYRAEILLGERNWADAVEALRPPVAQLPRVRAFLGYALARSGKRDEATRLLTDLKAGVETGRSSSFGVALVYAGLGDMDSTYAWLEKSRDDYSMLPAVMGSAFDDLRRDRRFVALRKSFELPGR